jgi:hypothetical protein
MVRDKPFEAVQGMTFYHHVDIPGSCQLVLLSGWCLMLKDCNQYDDRFRPPAHVLTRSERPIQRFGWTCRSAVIYLGGSYFSFQILQIALVSTPFKAGRKGIRSTLAVEYDSVA